MASRTSSVILVVSDSDLLAFMRALSHADRATTTQLLSTSPELATVRLMTCGTPTTGHDFFLRPMLMQLYSGDTALHVAAAAHDTVLAHKLDMLESTTR